MAKALQLPIIDLASLDRISTANSIRQACIECGFFYLINHGVEQELLKQVFDESKRFFSLPLEEKMKLLHRETRGYTPLYAENLNPSSSSKEVLPSWRPTIESYYERVLTAGKKLISLIALALNLDEDFFEKVGAFNPPMPFLRLLHYPG
ncbi:1-aminocyclopropane-1-carboxylate oxidase-like isoform X2 [Camellia sinensis]|uniref:1-aminocyclopropane-1-carboxylate oxidase-like isoform X2 n=1 Tax=Camellia sinensis TaxID=4442 RepID=UPI0010359F3F|nr:1-aminocyclopropane-1-carboxylate oxidase-like isoform X2 [Camellia sinensis]